MNRSLIDRPRRWLAPTLIAAQIVAVIAFGVALVSFYQPEKGFTQLVVFGAGHANHALSELKEIPHAEFEHSMGYDGQFYAQMALDPLLRDPDLPGAMDNPSYRFRRILMPALAHGLGLGRPSWALQAYSLLNGICWFLLAPVLLWWFKPGDLDGTLRWFGVLFGAGLLYSFRNALPDGPALLLMAVALVLAETERKKSAALALAMAGMTRETSLLGFGALPSASDLHPRAWKRWVIPALIAVLPLALWLLYVRVRLSGGDLATGLGARNFSWPFVAWAGAWVDTFRWDDWTSRIWVNQLSVMIGVSVQIFFFLFRWRWRERAWRLGIVFALLGLVLGPAVWEGYPGAAIRVLLPLTLAFNLALPRGRSWLPLLLAGNLSVIAATHVLDAPGSLFVEAESMHLVQVTGSGTVVGDDDRPVCEVSFSPEWYQLEYKGDHEWRWSPGNADITIAVALERSVEARVRLSLSALESCKLEVSMEDRLLWAGELDHTERFIEFPVRLVPGENTLTFRTGDDANQASWQDKRVLLYRLNLLEIAF